VAAVDGSGARAEAGRRGGRRRRDRGARSHQPIAAHDPSAHAEIVALRAAGAALGNYRITGGELYVTVEPCLMCVGAIVQARLRRVTSAVATRRAGRSAACST
jgi:tRNA(adenine34) deaminase